MMHKEVRDGAARPQRAQGEPAGLEAEHGIERAHLHQRRREHDDADDGRTIFEQRLGEELQTAEEGEIEQDQPQRGAQDTVEGSDIGRHGVLRT